MYEVIETLRSINEEQKVEEERRKNASSTKMHDEKTLMFP